jgi:hypothetical protein
MKRICPGCGAVVRPDGPVSPGQWLRCPHCERAFSPDVGDSPEGSWNKANIVLAVVPYLLVTLLLAGVVVLGYALYRQPNQPPAAAKVNREPNNPAAPPRAERQASPAPMKSAAVGVGLPAPEIEGQDADGKTFKLSDYRGKVVVLDFWARW